MSLETDSRQHIKAFETEFQAMSLASYIILPI
jgi:hypothetical protein